MKDYDKYFTVTSKSRKITPKEEAMREAARNYGYFALLSNEVNDPFEALSLYPGFPLMHNEVMKKEVKTTLK